MRSLLRPVNESVIPRSLAKFQCVLRSGSAETPRPEVCNAPERAKATVPPEALAAGGGGCSKYVRARRSSTGDASLLQLDLRTSVFELLLDFGGLVLGDIGLDVLRSPFHQVLGFL